MTARYTAAEVRAAAGEPDHISRPFIPIRVREMLADYADWMEGEGKTLLAFTATECFALVPETAAEPLREQGRQEVLREVAEQIPDCWHDAGFCIFCSNTLRRDGQHKPNCLWLRAQQARAQEGK